MQSVLAVLPVPSVTALAGHDTHDANAVWLVSEWKVSTGQSAQVPPLAGSPYVPCGQTHDDTAGDASGESAREVQLTHAACVTWSESAL